MLLLLEALYKLIVFFFQAFWKHTPPEEFFKNKLGSSENLHFGLMIKMHNLFAF